MQFQKVNDSAQDRGTRRHDCTRGSAPRTAWPLTGPWTAVLVLAIVAVPVRSAADASIGLVMTAPAHPVLPGGVARFSVEALNFGPDPSTSVVLTCLPSGDYVGIAALVSGQGTCTGETPFVCELGTISPTAFQNSVLVLFDMTASAADAAGAMTLSCTLGAATPDPDPTTNSGTRSAYIFPLAAAADLRISLAEGPRAPSGARTVTIQVQNLGPSTASTTTVTAGIEGLTLASAGHARTGPPFCISDLDTCVGGACVSALGEPFRVTCDLGDLPFGSTVSASFDASLGEGSWTAFGDASSDAPDPTPLDVHAAYVVVVNPPAPPDGSSGGGCETAGATDLLGGLLGAALLRFIGHAARTRAARP